MLHLYAVARDRPDLSCTGLDGEEVRTRRCGPWWTLTTAHPRAPERSAEAVRRHVEVVERYSERLDVLPVRFGAQHEDDEGLAAAVAADGPSLQAAFGRIVGHRELVLRRRPSRTPDGELLLVAGGAGAGDQDLEDRLAAPRPAFAEQQAVHEAMDRCAATVADRVTEVVDRPSPRGLERSLLVPRRDVAEVQAALAERTAGAPVVVVGPSAPYRFAGWEGHRRADGIRPGGQEARSRTSRR